MNLSWSKQERDSKLVLISRSAHSLRVNVLRKSAHRAAGYNIKDGNHLVCLAR